MDAYGNIGLSTTSKNLLKRLQTKELDLCGFSRECAFWAIKDGFDELRPYPLPTAPTTQAFAEYENLPPERRAKVDPDFFRKNYEIIEYYKQVLFVCHRNNANLWWLEEISKHLKEDYVIQKKIENRILEFKSSMDNNPLMVEKIKSVFKARETPKKSYYNTGEVIDEL